MPTWLNWGIWVARKWYSSFSMMREGREKPHEEREIEERKKHIDGFYTSINVIM